MKVGSQTVNWASFYTDFYNHENHQEKKHPELKNPTKPNMEPAKLMQMLSVFRRVPFLRLL